MDYILRKASVADRPSIEQLIVASARGLSRADYSEEQIEGAIKTVFGVDTNLILDGTYFVADNDGELIGCGGWGKSGRGLGGGQNGDRYGYQTNPQNKGAGHSALFIFLELLLAGSGPGSLCRLL